jgi:hypothetical protein
VVPAATSLDSVGGLRYRPGPMHALLCTSARIWSPEGSYVGVRAFGHELRNDQPTKAAAT